jgi:AI-2 transport protein TqsA
MSNTGSSEKIALYARFALILHAVVLIILLLYFGKLLFIPLFFSLLIAILLHPLARYFEKLHLGRGIAAALSVLIFVLFIGGFIYFFSLELARFSIDLPQLKDRFTVLLQDLQNWISYKYHIDTASQKTYIAKSSNQLVSQAVSSIGTTFLGIIEILILTIFIFFFTFFILLHRILLRQFLLSLFKRENNSKVNEVVMNTRSVINNYVIGLFVEMFVLILLSFPALALLGIKYALLLSVMAAVLNVIPYLGIYTAAALGMLITFADGNGTGALEVGILFIVVHVIDANLLVPRIVGGRVKINPLVILTAILVGRLIWGIPGMFLFIPLTAILRIISEAVDAMKPWAILIGEEGREIP